MTQDDQYEHWFYNARHPETDMPYGTHLLYQVCDQNEYKFQKGEELLKVAFLAGMEAQKKKEGK
jgi:hypothetical protein